MTPAPPLDHESGAEFASARAEFAGAGAEFAGAGGEMIAGEDVARDPASKALYGATHGRFLGCQSTDGSVSASQSNSWGCSPRGFPCVLVMRPPAATQDFRWNLWQALTFWLAKH